MNKKIVKAAINAGLFITLSILLLTFTFSWFVNTKNGDVGNIDTNVKDITEVYISPNGKDSWSDKLVISSTLEGKSISEYSGNGQYLYKPVYSNNEVKSFYLEKSKNPQYIDIETFIRIKGPAKIILGSNSRIIPVDKENVKNGIAGAVRMAILDEQISEENPFIWVPNTDYHYDSLTKTVNFNSPTVEENFIFAYDLVHSETLKPNALVRIQTQNKLSGITSSNLRNTKINNFVWGDISQINGYDDKVIPLVESFGYESKIKKLTLRFWIEGTDREAQANLIGGKFKINIHFKVISNQKAGVI